MNLRLCLKNSSLEKLWIQENKMTDAGKAAVKRGEVASPEGREMASG